MDVLASYLGECLDSYMFGREIMARTIFTARGGLQSAHAYHASTRNDTFMYWLAVLKIGFGLRQLRTPPLRTGYERVQPQLHQLSQTSVALVYDDYPAASLAGKRYIWLSTSTL